MSTGTATAPGVALLGAASGPCDVVEPVLQRISDGAGDNRPADSAPTVDLLSRYEAVGLEAHKMAMRPAGVIDAEPVRHFARGHGSIDREHPKDLCARMAADGLGHGDDLSGLAGGSDQLGHPDIFADWRGNDPILSTS